MFFVMILKLLHSKGRSAFEYMKFMYLSFQCCNSWKDLYIAMVTSSYLSIVKGTMFTSRTSGSSAILGHFEKKMFSTYKLHTCLT